MSTVDLTTVIDDGELGGKEGKIPLSLEKLVEFLRVNAGHAPHDARQETWSLADALVEKDYTRGLALCAWIQAVVKNWTDGPEEVRLWAHWVGVARLHCKRALH
jgi:hypothetical protein